MIPTELASLLSVVKELPYGRNSDRSNYRLVPIEKIGSCSTKHAYIKHVSTERNWKGVKLMLCIYMMSEKNTHGVGSVLNQYQLTEIPEAHTFLEIHGEKVDVTGLASAQDSFISSIQKIEVIEPDQIGDYKINWHKEFIKSWAMKSPYTPDELWHIREMCIKSLSMNLDEPNV